jgi:hypothetical protein
MEAKRKLKQHDKDKRKHSVDQSSVDNKHKETSASKPKKELVVDYRSEAN